jgi:OFA family oxalate/formate antiporter-like MFS transporter
VFGEIYSLFPATQGDTFGAKYAASNAGMLYTAKGTASFLVPLAAWLAGMHGWISVFWVAIAFNVTAALLAVLVLKPMRARWYAGDARAVGAATAGDPVAAGAGAPAGFEAQLPSA